MTGPSNGVKVDKRDFTESWSFIMGFLFMAAVLGFRGGIIGILRTKLRLSI